MWGSFGAFAGGQLGAKLGEQLAVAIADRNRCEYCLAAHNVLGANAGLSPETLAQAQRGEVVELVGVTALNLFTNYINNALEVPVDFKAVELTA
uniref:CMD domain-containing protein n=1 Tax=Steinernema glaseri TaxID=37863 RepID=A0A1I7YHL4_9BILA